MSEIFEQIPILVGDITTATHPVRRLYDEKRFHERTQPRFFWPVQPAQPQISHDLYERIDSTAKPLWIEIGFSPGTSLSYVTPYKVRKILAYDDRSWVSRLMCFAHNPKTFALYQELVKHYEPSGGPSVHDLIHLRRIADPVNRWDRAGVALYLLAMAGGRAGFGVNIASSVPIVTCGPTAEATRSNTFPICPVQIVDDLEDLTLNLAKMLKPMRRSVHFSLNRIPFGAPFRRVIEVLTRYEMAWSASFILDEIQEGARLEVSGAKTIRSGQIVHILPY